VAYSCPFLLTGSLSAQRRAQQAVGVTARGRARKPRVVPAVMMCSRRHEVMGDG